MHGPRNELLTGPAFTRDHHSGAAVSRLSDGFEDLENPQALADEPLEAVLTAQLALELAILVLEALTLQRVRDGEAQLVELEGLGDVVIRTEFHRLHGRLGRSERGHHEHDGPR